MTTTATADHDDYIAIFSAFLSTQPQFAGIGMEALKTALTPTELGMTSLGVITLLVSYLETKGVPGTEFNPEWVGRLESVQGIVSVCREIDQCSGKPAGAAMRT